MSKWHSERCESRSKNNLRNNSKGITTTKSKLSIHDRLCTLVLTPVKTSVHDVTFSEWQWMQLIRMNCLINQKKNMMKTMSQHSSYFCQSVVIY